jgi:hypothetical protein
MGGTTKIAELAEVLRSKNASPFITTCDIFFKNEEGYRRVKESGVITKDLIARLYNLPVEDIITLQYLDIVKGLKISFLKPIPAGAPGCTDTFGAQQHAPLLSIEIP